MKPDIGRFDNELTHINYGIARIVLSIAHPPSLKLRRGKAKNTLFGCVARQFQERWKLLSEATVFRPKMRNGGNFAWFPPLAEKIAELRVVISRWRN